MKKLLIAIIATFIASSAFSAPRTFKCVDEKQKYIVNLNLDGERSSYSFANARTRKTGQAHAVVNGQFPWSGSVFFEDMSGGLHLYFKSWENRARLVIPGFGELDMVCKRAK